MNKTQLKCLSTDNTIKLHDVMKCNQIWNLLKKDYEDDISTTYHPYFMFTYFPSSDKQVKIFTKYSNEGLIDYDDAIINQTHHTIWDQISALFVFRHNKLTGEDLEKMNWYLEEGRIYAEDNDITRTLEMITVKEKKTGDIIFRYFTLVRKDPINIPKVMSDIENNKRPEDERILDKILLAKNNPEKGVEIEHENIYVLSGCLE